MTHYIDANRLKEQIQGLINLGYDKLQGNLYHVLNLIDSLQQESSKVDLVAELEHHLATTPKEQLEKEWKELEPWGNIGPTVQEFLYGKQPEADLEKEIDACWQNWLSPSNQKEIEGVLPKTEFAMYARHFYKLGKNSK